MVEKHLKEDFLCFFLASPKIDTHEHLLPPETFFRKQDILLAILRESYLPQIYFGTKDLWKVSWDKLTLLASLNRVKSSVFFQYLRKAFQFMCGFFRDLQQEKDREMFTYTIRRAYAEKDPVTTWLKEKLHVGKVVLDRYWVVDGYDVNRYFFAPVLRMDPYLYSFWLWPGTMATKTPILSKQEREGRWSLSRII